MWKRTILAILILFGTTLIGSGCLSLIQPKSEIIERYNFIDMDATVRLAKPVEGAEILIKKDGKWVPGGTGDLPAGAYIKGRAPKLTP